MEEPEKYYFPYEHGTKIRDESNGRKFYYDPRGMELSLFNLQDLQRAESRSEAFICEGETDTMKLTQELLRASEGRLKTPVIGLPGVQTWKPEWAKLLSGYAKVYIVLDNEGYVDGSKIRRQIENDLESLGIRTKQVYLPSGTKDIVEFFRMGASAQDFISLARTYISPFKPLDLSQIDKPRNVDWYIENIVGRGDITLVMGEPSVGKSWVTMGLTAALLRGERDFLGCNLLPAENERILYVDEENPQDVVLDRLKLLGVTNRDSDRLRYLHAQGVSLDKNPQLLLEEAKEFQPTVVVLDSLTRFHSGNENNAGEISALFNAGIRPLSREIGATTFVIHHARKPSMENSPYARARGSGDITASVDCAIDVRRGLLPGTIELNHFKSRRRLPHDPIDVIIRDYYTGGERRVELISTHKLPI